MIVGDEIERQYDTYIKEIGKVNSEVYNSTINLLSQYSINGTLEATPEQIAQIRSQLIETVRQSNYPIVTNYYLQLFDKIDGINDKYYRKEKIKLGSILTDNEVVKNARNNVIKQLRGEDLLINVITPIEQILVNKFINKGTFSDTLNILKDTLVDNSILSKYVENTAFDIMLQYDGAINNQVKQIYNLKYFYYVGSEIENTRPICSHIKDTFGSKTLSEDDLKKILDEYCPSGLPSEVKETYTTVNNVTMTKKKGAGMIKGTDISNFAQLRGGYRCRHEVKYTRFPKL